MDPKEAPQEPNEALLDLLEELTEKDFKKFKFHLESFPVTVGKSKVPRGSLEKADHMDTIELMRSHYDQSALQITANILERIPRKDLLPRVKALQKYLDQTGKRKRSSSQSEDLGHTGKRSSAQIKEIETKEKFKELMKRRFRAMEDENRLPGERVLLQDCYTKLLILKKQRPKKEREDEIMASGRRHLKLMARRAAHSYSSIQDLFKPEKDEHIPSTVVLQGVAGIGKTMTAQKILLDWASGHLFQDMFQYVFYIQCRELNQLGGQPTIADIILHICGGKSLLTMEAIEAEPQKVLFIIDGFDELKLPKDLPRDDPEKKPASNKSIIDLVRRRYLPESFLLITTRPTALEALAQYLVKCGNDERFAEILGFSEDDRKEYFNKFFGNIYFNTFFGNKSQGAQAFNVVKENEILYTMCFVPIVCWIVCKAIKQQMETKKEFAHLSKSTTSVYLLFLSGLLVKQSTGSQRSTVSNNLKRLCSLAYEGIRQQKILFEDEDLTRHGVDIPAVQSLFLTNYLFRKDDKRYNLYSFLHLSLQEFFAALYFILGEDEARAEHTENLCEQGGDEARAEHTENLQGQGGDEARAEHTENLQGQGEDEARAEHTENLQGQGGDEARAEHTENLQGQGGDEVRAEHTENLQGQGGDEARAEHTENLQGQGRDEARAGHTENLQGQGGDEEMAEYTENLPGQGEDEEMEEYTESLLGEEEDEEMEEYTESLLGEEEDEEMEEYTKSLLGQVTRLLRDYRRHGHLMLTVRFLFGLLNSDLLEKMQGSFQWKISREIKAALLEWVKSELKRCDSSKSTFGGMSDRGWDHQLELFRCLYETQDAEFVKQATEDGIDVDVDDEHLERLRRSAMDRRALGFYLEHSSRVKSMRVSMEDDPEFWRALAPALRKCSWLSVSGRMDATTKCWPELLLPLRRNSVLTGLDLDKFGEDPAFMKELCEALAHSDCEIQTLGFSDCSLTAACCSDLASLIRGKPSLTELDLSDSKLEDSGVKALCKGLEDPGCKIQRLRLGDSSLTASCCAALSSVLSKSTSLIDLYLGGNKLEDSGVKMLCKGLKDPGCRLQELCLHSCSLTDACCEDLVSVLNQKPSLQDLRVDGNDWTETARGKLREAGQSSGCRICWY
ncbi:NACHT, LRR and PYD domains-containing protein 3-like isoform X2 [Ambystoma mexicanum]|uniref:NACHT, LRR and PYD domains-containing protein 3-like isoform X2 n=1 Tax=Ambystoma mexicanum TaxID=8296 RepID=UPI0037E8E621